MFLKLAVYLLNVALFGFVNFDLLRLHDVIDY